jgi:branched-chain amino acid aminotransferase
VITVQNRSFRYGDGVFETIKIFRSEILLSEYHFDRLFTSLSLLKIPVPVYLSCEKLRKDILDLCNLNSCQNSARVRMAVYRDEENNAGIVIEAYPLDEKVNALNEDGWLIDIYPYARKSTDPFANLKSANYLPYVMADLYAKENAQDECLVLNCDNKISDASKANVFLVLKKDVYTPALHQGCVNGVKRRFIIEELKKQAVAVHQQAIDEEMLFEADEVFLTNAINDIRWVKSFRNKNYSNFFIAEFYKKICAGVYS